MFIHKKHLNGKTKGKKTQLIDRPVLLGKTTLSKVIEFFFFFSESLSSFRLQTYFLEKALLAFSDFLSTGERNTKEEVVPRNPMEPRTKAWLLQSSLNPLPLKVCVSSKLTVLFLTIRHTWTHGVVMSAKFL